MARLHVRCHANIASGHLGPPEAATILYIPQSLPVPWRVLRLWENLALRSLSTRRAVDQLSVASGEPLVRVIAMGDVALTRPPSYDAAAIFGELLPLLAGADLRIANLEAVITTRESPSVAIGSQIRARPQALDVLTEAGLDVVSIANNHVLDFGAAALDESRSLLASRGIDACGVSAADGEAQLVVRTVGGLRLGFLAFCDDHAGVDADQGTRPCAFTPESALSAITSARRRVDLLVVQMHWGYEFTLHPLLRHRDAARHMIEAGAHAVLCHHAHVPQGVEVWKTGVIAYGLGNAIMPSSTYLREGHEWTNRSFMLELGLHAGGVAYLRLHPFKLGEDGRLAPLTGGLRRGLLAGLARMSQRLADTRFLGRIERARMLYEACQMASALHDAAARGDQQLVARVIALSLPRQRELIAYLREIPELLSYGMALEDIVTHAPHAEQIRAALERHACILLEGPRQASALHRWQDALASRIP
jgi:poly-gamma-glutamate synthesis protein (capsule biosynthesis protein)